jgi:hypothetical protein
MPGKPGPTTEMESAMKHTRPNITHRAERLFYSGQSWVRQDESGRQQLAVEFGHVVYAHGPRHAKADD